MSGYILAIDEGTTGTRSYVFDAQGRVRGSSYREFTQFFPRPGWVEHDALEIWEAVQATTRGALRAAGLKASSLAAIGITNQRETTVVWDRATGRPIHRAIVWQCRRTAERCEQLKRQGMEGRFRVRTGLLLDAYFSGTKIEWLLKNVPGAMDRARRRRLAFGTIDSWLLWNLTGGASHATDPTNASRTLLFDIRRKRWDPQLCRILGVPSSILPRVQESASDFGKTSSKGFLGSAIPVTGIAGDQQAALYGQGCHAPGTLKNTYGTGCFLLLNLGRRFLLSKNRLLTTLGCDGAGRPAYVLEGAVFIGGAAIQWVRDGLGLLKSSAESEGVARSVKGTGGVYLVPAFVGLGAPYWDARARGAILGITRGTTRAHVVRAALESLAFQTRDVVEAMRKDSGHPVRELRVDGGACRNDVLLQFQADLLGAHIDRPRMVETTAMGAAYLAGLQAGLFRSAEFVRRVRRTDRVFRPHMGKTERERLWSGWKDAVRRTLTR